MEIWPIKKPVVDRASFAAILDRFPNKVFLANADTKVSEMAVTTADVLKYMASGNRLHRDLGNMEAWSIVMKIGVPIMTVIYYAVHIFRTS